MTQEASHAARRTPEGLETPSYRFVCAGDGYEARRRATVCARRHTQIVLVYVERSMLPLPPSLSVCLSVCLSLTWFCYAVHAVSKV